MRRGFILSIFLFICFFSSVSSLFFLWLEQLYNWWYHIWVVTSLTSIMYIKFHPYTHCKTPKMKWKSLINNTLMCSEDVMITFFFLLFLLLLPFSWLSFWENVLYVRFMSYIIMNSGKLIAPDALQCIMTENFPLIMISNSTCRDWYT